jgi:hypothetical protein
VALLSFSDRWIRPPAELRKLFVGQERALAVGDTEHSVVVATNYGLWLPVADEPSAGWRRIGWDLVVKANWAADRLVLIEGVLHDSGQLTDLPAVTVDLVEPRNLPSVVRTRVEASIARSEQVNLPGGTGRLVARRVPGVDGLTWTARLDAATPSTELDVQTLLAYLDRARDAPTE